jgi:hypothetical protein
MVDGLRGLLAQRAKTTIRPPSLSQTVGDPNSILIDKPSEQLNLWRRPRLPNRLV